MVRLILSAILLVTVSACGSGDQNAATTRLPSGEALYARHCSACHGQFGEGDGPVSIAMRVSVPDLRTISRRNGGTFPREDIIQFIDGRDLPASHGDSYMPVWGDVFRLSSADAETSESTVRARIEALTDFLARIQN